MEHEQAQQLFSAHQDGELDEARARELEAHLEACEACRGEYQAFQQALSLVRGLGPTPAPDDFLEGVQRKIRSRSKGAYFRVKSVSVFPFRLPYELFSLLMILVLVALMVVQSMIAVVRPEQDPAVRLQRPGPGEKALPGPAPRSVLPLRREEIRYRYVFQGRPEELQPQLLELAERLGAERLPCEGAGLDLRVPRENFKPLTSKLLENLKFRVERERGFTEAPSKGVALEIRFEPP